MLRWPSLSIRSTVLIAIIVGMVLPALVVLGADTVIARAAHEPLMQRNRAAVLVLGTFIQTAEETGLIRELGQWTLDAACAQLAAWKAADLHPGRVAVNVSALQFRDQRLPQVLGDTLRRHGIQPGELELE
jgi:predicted signal transduction protein with EAL and GGDEF domain